MNSNCDVLTKVKINTEIEMPKLYSVVYFNDNKTTSLFVAQSLVDVFDHSIDAALALTESIDKNGSGVAAQDLAKEIAQHLRDLVISKARAQEFPLVVEIKEQ